MGKDNTISIEQLLAEIEAEMVQLNQDIALWDERFKNMPASTEVLAQHEAKKLLIVFLADWQNRFQKILQ